jgi:predicted permease
MTGGANRARAALIVTEVALAVVLVSGAALMLRTIAQLQRVDPGFRTSHVLTLRVQPSHLQGSDQLRAYWRELLPKLAALPDVQAVGTVLHLPMSGRKWNTALEREGVALPAGSAPPRSAWQSVGGDYFQAMGIALLRGRLFAEADHENAPRVVIVNDQLARQLWPDRDPVGQRMRAGRPTNQEWATVIGVVRAVRHDSLNMSAGPELYTHFPQNTVGSTSVVLRTGGNPKALAGAVRNTIWSLSREVPISNLRSIDEVLAQSIMRRRVVLTLLGAFALVGVLLGLVGIYGLVAHAVRQRTREIGIRMALGAAPRAVLQLMIAVGLQWTALGVAIGTVIAFALAGFMQSLIFGIAPHDPLALILAPLLLLGVAALAALLPARRAAALNPARVLQE